MFFQFVVLQMCIVQYPIWATEQAFLPEAPQGLYYMSMNSKDSGKTALMSLCWLPFSLVLAHTCFVSVMVIDIHLYRNVLYLK